MQPVGRPCGTWMHYTVDAVDALCYEGCEGHGTANGLPQPRIELAERSHEQTLLGQELLMEPSCLNLLVQ